MTNHPITPPPELVQQIRSDALHRSGDVLDYELRMIHASYRAGADQELEACCEWLKAKEWIHPEFSDELRAARRPKPADGEAAKLVAWLRKTSRAAFMDGWPNEESINLTRAAELLERLQELENND